MVAAISFKPVGDCADKAHIAAQQNWELSSKANSWVVILATLLPAPEIDGQLYLEPTIEVQEMCFLNKFSSTSLSLVVFHAVSVLLIGAQEAGKYLHQ